MRTIHFIEILVLCYSFPLFAEENKTDVTGSYTIDSIKNEINLKIVVSNNNEVGIYIPLSHWDFDGIEDSRGRYLGYGDETYIVQRIRYRPVSISQGTFVGDKGWWPEYKVLPRFLFVKNGQKDSLRVIIEGEKAKILTNGKFCFEVDLCFTTTYEMRLLDQIIPEATFKNIAETRSPDIWISKFRGITEQNLSSVQVPNGRSEFIRELFRY